MQYFEKKIESLTVSEVLSLTDALLSSKDDAILKRHIFGLNTLLMASENEVSFYSNSKYAKELSDTKAGLCFIKQEDVHRLNQNSIALISRDPYLCFAKLLTHFYGNNELEGLEIEGIHTSASIAKTAKIGNGVKLAQNVVISENVILGDGVIILPNTFIGFGVKIGKNTIIHDNCSIMFAEIGEESIIRSGARIGTSGFGFAPNLKTGKHVYIPQISGVKIGNFVDIGANTVIDRGALETTEIMDNAKLDNLIQIAHGVKIGTSTFIAGQVGIAGSTEVGNFCFLGAQVGVNGHIKIADFTQVGGKAGVVNSVKEKGQILSGFPAIPKIQWNRMQVKLKKLISKEK
jgi:UDP-3-O-[3-hydroxymyristoyl] glucosamine N-acyltransferase